MKISIILDCCKGLFFHRRIRLLKIFTDSVIVTFCFLISLGVLCACTKKSGTEVLLMPEILSVSISGQPATLQGSTFSVALSNLSTLDLKNIKATDIVFTKSQADAKISPEGPYNFTDAINNAIPISISLNGQTKHYTLQVKKSAPPIAEDPTTVYATWIMVWVGSTEGWFDPVSYNGATMWVNNTWKSTNWNDNSQVDEFVVNMRDAGIKIIVCDLTNGFKWMSKVKYIQGLCASYGMQVCVAENYGGNFSNFDRDAQSVYDNLAGPNASNNTAYLKKEGKPLIVCYCTKTNFEAIQPYSSTIRNYFNVVWSSGEQSAPNKWGWQLEPKVGPVPSTDAMFVTSSVKWASGVNEIWRKSLAWLDYNFIIARQNKPKYIIVGSYDDMHERNGWLIANTTNCIQGRQMRDKFGAISNDAYFNRIKEWTGGGAISSVGGGLVKDGCYSLVNVKSSLPLQIRGGNGAAGSILEQSLTPIFLLNKYFWLYHLGDNIYRMISLPAGLSIAPTGGSSDDGVAIEQNWDLDVPYQKWKLEQTTTGKYAIRNLSTGKYLEVKGGSMSSGADIIQSFKTGQDQQLWNLETIVQL